MKIGFIGIGNIATCMIEGFCGLGTEHDFFLSPRNAEKSAELSAKYPNVEVCQSNQHVVDASDIVFLTMNTPDCVKVIKNLNFRGDQHIINVIATTPPEDVREAAGPVGSFSQIIPLPSVRLRYGPIAAYPESPLLSRLLTPLGTVVFVEALGDIRTMQALTSTIAAFYDTMHHLTVFAEGEGLAKEQSIPLLSSFFASLCQNMLEADFDELMGEMTPGGLNEMALSTLRSQGVTKAWADALVSVLERVKKV